MAVRDKEENEKQSLLEEAAFASYARAVEAISPESYERAIKHAAKMVNFLASRSPTGETTAETKIKPPKNKGLRIWQTQFEQAIERVFSAYQNPDNSLDQDQDPRTLLPLINLITDMSNYVIASVEQKVSGAVVQNKENQESQVEEAQTVTALAYLLLMLMTLSIEDFNQFSENTAEKSAKWIGEVKKFINTKTMGSLQTMIERVGPKAYVENIHEFWNRLIGRYAAGKDVLAPKDKVIPRENFLHAFKVKKERTFPHFMLAYTLLKNMVIARRPGSEEMRKNEKVFVEGKTHTALPMRDKYWITFEIGTEAIRVGIPADLLTSTEPDAFDRFKDYVDTEIDKKKDRDRQLEKKPKRWKSIKDIVKKNGGLPTKKQTERELENADDIENNANYAYSDLRFIVHLDPNLDKSGLREKARAKQNDSQADPVSGAFATVSVYIDNSGKETTGIIAQHPHREHDAKYARNELVTAIQEASKLAEQKNIKSVDKRAADIVPIDLLFHSEDTPIPIYDTARATMVWSDVEKNDDFKDLADEAKKFGIYIDWNVILALAVMMLEGSPHLHMLEATKYKGIAPSLYEITPSILKKFRNETPLTDLDKMIFINQLRLHQIDRALVVAGLGVIPTIATLTEHSAIRAAITKVTQFTGPEEQGALTKSIMISSTVTQHGSFTPKEEELRNLEKEREEELGEEEAAEPVLFTTVFSSVYNRNYGVLINKRTMTVSRRSRETNDAVDLEKFDQDFNVCVVRVKEGLRRVVKESFKNPELQKAMEVVPNAIVKNKGK